MKFYNNFSFKQFTRTLLENEKHISFKFTRHEEIQLKSESNKKNKQVKNEELNRNRVPSPLRLPLSFGKVPREARGDDEVGSGEVPRRGFEPESGGQPRGGDGDGGEVSGCQGGELPLHREGWLPWLH